MHVPEKFTGEREFHCNRGSPISVKKLISVCLLPHCNAVTEATACMVPYARAFEITGCNNPSQHNHPDQLSHDSISTCNQNLTLFGLMRGSELAQAPRSLEVACDDCRLARMQIFGGASGLLAIGSDNASTMEVLETIYKEQKRSVAPCRCGLHQAVLLT